MQQETSGYGLEAETKLQGGEIPAPPTSQLATPPSAHRVGPGLRQQEFSGPTSATAQRSQREEQGKRIRNHVKRLPILAWMLAAAILRACAQDDPTNTDGGDLQLDTGTRDAGTRDAGTHRRDSAVDASVDMSDTGLGGQDASIDDSGTRDGAMNDAAAADASLRDATVTDADADLDSAVDVGPGDSGPEDGGEQDATTFDSDLPDTSGADGGADTSVDSAVDVGVDTASATPTLTGIGAFFGMREVFQTRAGFDGIRIVGEGTHFDQITAVTLVGTGISVLCENLTTGTEGFECEFPTSLIVDRRVELRAAIAHATGTLMSSAIITVTQTVVATNGTAADGSQPEHGSDFQPGGRARQRTFDHRRRHRRGRASWRLHHRAAQCERRWGTYSRQLRSWRHTSGLVHKRPGNRGLRSAQNKREPRAVGHD